MPWCIDKGVRDAYDSQLAFSKSYEESNFLTSAVQKVACNHSGITGNLIQLATIASLPIDAVIRAVKATSAGMMAPIVGLREIGNRSYLALSWQILTLAPQMGIGFGVGLVRGAQTIGIMAQQYITPSQPVRGYRKNAADPSAIRKYTLPHYMGGTPLYYIFGGTKAAKAYNNKKTYLMSKCWNEVNAKSSVRKGIQEKRITFLSFATELIQHGAAACPGLGGHIIQLATCVSLPLDVVLKMIVIPLYGTLMPLSIFLDSEDLTAKCWRVIVLVPETGLMCGLSLLRVVEEIGQMAQQFISPAGPLYYISRGSEAANEFLEDRGKKGKELGLF